MALALVPLALIGVLVARPSDRRADVRAGAVALYARTWSVPDIAPENVPDEVVALLDERRAAVEADPGSHAAWFEYAATLHAHEHPLAAYEAYRRAAQLRPDDPRPPYLMGLISDAEGMPLETTLAHLDASLALDPRYPPTYVRKGDVLADAGRLEAARAALTEAVEVDPSYPMAHRKLGEVLLELGDTGQALVHLEFAAELVPTDQLVWSALARAYQRAEREADARAAGERAERLDDVISYRDGVFAAVNARNIGTLDLLQQAYRYERVGDYTRALPLLERAAQRVPDWPIIHWRLSEAYAATGDVQRAGEHRRRAEALERRVFGEPE